MAELDVGSQVAGHRIEGVAGRGGMGVVYIATDLELDRRVALKLIAPEYASDLAFRERFKRESRLAASINHPHVITIHRAGEDGGLLFITMEYVEGTDLRELIASRGQLDPATAAATVAQVGSALDAAHERGLVHRDIKPANVLIAGSNGSLHAYLTDFGLVKRADSQSSMTRAGTFVGTLDYAAPEQLQGQTVDARTDVYALGCLLYHVLSGSVPYPRDTDAAKMFAHIGQPPPVLAEEAPHAPPQFQRVIERAMAKDPADRHPSAGDLARAALEAAGGPAVHQPEANVATGEAAPATRIRGLPAAPTAPGGVPQPSEPPGGRTPLRARFGGRTWGALAAAALLLAAVPLAVLLLGGDANGGGRLSQPEYEARVSDLLRPFNRQVARVSGRRIPIDVGDADDAVQAGDLLARLRDSLSPAIRPMRALEPPAAVSELHASYMREMAALVTTLDAGIAAADANDQSAYTEALEELVASIDRIEDLNARFEAAGYDRIGTSAEEAADTGGRAEPTAVRATLLTFLEAVDEDDQSIICGTITEAHVESLTGSTTCDPAAVMRELRALEPPLPTDDDLTKAQPAVTIDGTRAVTTLGSRRFVLRSQRTESATVWQVASVGEAE